MADNEITNEQNEITNSSLVKDAARELFESLTDKWQDIDYENAGQIRKRAIEALTNGGLIYSEITEQFDNARNPQFSFKRTFYCTGNLARINELFKQKHTTIYKNNSYYRELFYNVSEGKRTDRVELTMWGLEAKNDIRNGKVTLDAVIDEIVDGYFEETIDIPPECGDIFWDTIPIESGNTKPEKVIIETIENISEKAVEAIWAKQTPPAPAADKTKTVPAVKERADNTDKSVKKNRKHGDWKISIESAVNTYGANTTDKFIATEIGMSPSQLSNTKFPYANYLLNARTEYCKKQTAKNTAEYSEGKMSDEARQRGYDKVATEEYVSPLDKMIADEAAAEEAKRRLF